MSTIPASGALTRLAILGSLSYAPMHGYEIRQEIERRRLERWADISYGSIYGRLRRLVDEGMVEIVRTERESNRPARTVHRITSAGEEELARSMHAALSQADFSAHTIDLALSYCATPAGRLGAELLVRLLRKRLVRLGEVADELRAALVETVSDQPGVRALVDDLVSHSQRRVAVEHEWTEHVLGRVTAGDYYTPPTGPIDTTDLRMSAGENAKP